MLQKLNSNCYFCNPSKIGTALLVFVKWLSDYAIASGVEQILQICSTPQIHIGRLSERGTVAIKGNSPFRSIKEEAP